VKVNPKDGAEMVLIPAGEFLMGTSKEQLAECLEDVLPGQRLPHEPDLLRHRLPVRGAFAGTITPFSEEHALEPVL